MAATSARPSMEVRKTVIAAQLAELQAENSDLTAQIDKIRKTKEDTTLLKYVTGRVAPLPRTQLSVRRVLRGHFAKVHDVQWCEANNFVVSASQDGNLLIWNPNTLYKIHAIGLRCHWVMTCSYSPSGRMVASGGLDNVCSIFRVDGARSPSGPERVLQNHTDSEIITSSGDASCIIWDVEQGKAVHSLLGHSSDVMSIASAPNKQLLVSGGCDTSAKLWDMRRTNKSVMTFRGHTSDINSVAFFPDGQAFVTGSDDASCRLWDIRAGREMMRYDKRTDPCGVASVCFSRSGRLLFSSYEDCNIFVWDTLHGANIGVLAKEHEKRVGCMSMSSAGDALCTGSWDNVIKIWA